MKKQIRAIAAVAAATMLLTGCAAHQQNNASEQTPTTQTQSSTASSVSTETTLARENWSLLDHLPEWSDGTVTPAVTADPSSAIPFWENPLNDDDWTKSLSLDGAPMFFFVLSSFRRQYYQMMLIQRTNSHCQPSLNSDFMWRHMKLGRMDIYILHGGRHASTRWAAMSRPTNCLRSTNL